MRNRNDKPSDPITRIHPLLLLLLPISISCSGASSSSHSYEERRTLEVEIMMSEDSGASSGISVGRYKGEGIPERCWCESGIVLRMSKSEANPSRRYFRCELAACKKIVNDNHVFKWVDDALVFEVNKLKREVESLKEELKDHQKVIEAVYEKMDYGLVEAENERSKMWKKMVIVVACSIVFVVGFSKLV